MSGRGGSEWHLITAEYPPQAGGVSDYAHSVAVGLAAAGDRVHVWCPPAPGETPSCEGVEVHRECGSFGATDLRRVGRRLDSYPTPRRLLVQWVPHGFGWRSANVGFCLWLLDRARRSGDAVEIMAHEVMMEFSARSWRVSAAAFAHRVMSAVLLQAAERVWVSVPQWERILRPFAFGRRVPIEWLPIPSNIPVVRDPVAVAVIRRRLVPERGALIGHFGTYGPHVRELLGELLPELLERRPDATLLLLGRGSEEYGEQLVSRHRALLGRVHASGGLEPGDLSHHLSACDLLVQPYPDGVSSRRTSVMAGLSHSAPIVTTIGRLTEPLWAHESAVALVPVGDVEAAIAAVVRLLDDRAERARLSTAAGRLYAAEFEMGRTLGALRHAATSGS